VIATGGASSGSVEGVLVLGVGEALSTWQFDATPTAGVILAGLGYGLAWRRLPARRGHARRVRGRGAAFGLGLLVLLLAVDGPPDGLADRSFAAHMVQHLLLQLVAAPLLVLGAPISLLLRADPPWLPRRLLGPVLRIRAVRVLSHPVLTFTAFAAALIGTHLSPLYDLTLRNASVHEVEHVVYLVTACMFWWPVVGTDPGPAKPSHPARLLYLLLSMPVMAFLGIAIAGSGQVLYPHYAQYPPPWGATPLQDQHVAGTLMWISGMLVVPPALALVLLRWLDHDERETARGPARRPTAVHAGGGA
jgi:putative membrane protein